MSAGTKLYAAVRYFDDDTKEVHVIKVQGRIMNFNVAEAFTKPYWVNAAERAKGDGDCHWRPAEVLALNNDYSILAIKKKAKTYKISDMKLSEAMRILIKQNNVQDSSEEEPTDTQSPHRQVPTEPQSSPTELRVVQQTKNTTEIINEQPLYAAVRFYNDQSNNVHFVSVAKIRDFAISEDYPKPFWVNAAKDALEEDWQPAQVLKVDEQIYQLKNPGKRYKFNKMRMSDALQELNAEAIRNGKGPNEEEEIQNESSPKRVPIKNVQVVKKANKTSTKVPWKSTAEMRDKEENERILETKKKGLLLKSKKLQLNVEYVDYFNSAPRPPPVPNVQDVQTENTRTVEESNYQKIIDSLEKENLSLKKKIVQCTKKPTNTNRVLEHSPLFADDLLTPNHSPNKERNNSPNNSPTSTPKAKGPSSARKQLFFSKGSPILGSTKQQRMANKRGASSYDSERDSEKLIRNKKKLKKSSKKKEKKLLDYDSDDYKGLTDKTKYKVWFDEENEGNIKMMHLRYGISVPYNAWKKARDQDSSKMFVRRLADALWEQHDLANRAIDLSKVTKKQLDGHDSPRKQLTPIKSTVMKKCYIDYMKLHNLIPRKSTEKEKIKLLNKWTLYLGIYINALIKKEEEEGSYDDQKNDELIDSDLNDGDEESEA